MKSTFEAFIMTQYNTYIMADIREGIKCDATPLNFFKEAWMLNEEVDVLISGN